ncbi:MAG: metallophosphoesterase [Eubacteriales bacterium]|nr:metallophosphoesterase [Eubacteriales bacterium]MDY3332672.1 metallophosphoesterase [Gallibacter sp.]
MIIYIIAAIYILINIFLLRKIFIWIDAVIGLKTKKKEENINKVSGKFYKIIAFATYLFIFLSPLFAVVIKGEYNRFFKIISNYWIGIFIITLVIVLLKTVILFIIKRFNPDIYNDINEKPLLVGLVLTTVIIVVAVYGFYNAKDIKTVAYEVNIDKKINLNNKATDKSNLRVALIADTHFGYSIGYEEMKETVDIINKHNVDLVVVAGDIFDNAYEAMDNPQAIIDEFNRLKSTYGTYACFGNHDIPEYLLSGFTVQGNGKYLRDDRFNDFFKKANINLLEDKSVLIDKSFYLIGRKDPSMSHKLKETRLDAMSIVKDNVKDSDSYIPIIVIDHQPNDLENLAKAGVDVTLSGHTHDGQIFPGNILMKFLWKNPHGIKQFDRMQSIVTSGVGLWGPPIRIGTHSEVMILDIKNK